MQAVLVFLDTKGDFVTTAKKLNRFTAAQAHLLRDLSARYCYNQYSSLRNLEVNTAEKDPYLLTVDRLAKAMVRGQSQAVRLIERVSLKIRCSLSWYSVTPSKLRSYKSHQPDQHDFTSHAFQTNTERRLASAKHAAAPDALRHYADPQTSFGLSI